MSDAYVWIDPARKSGEPCVGGHRVPVEMVIGVVWESSVDNAMDLWCLTRAEVLGACWYAGVGNVVRLHGKGGKYVAHRGPWRKRWGVWARQVHGALWSSTTCNYGAVPDPPREAAS